MRGGHVDGGPRRPTTKGRRTRAAVTEARAEGRHFLLVLTVSPSDGPDEIPDGYQATRLFYEANSFVLARDFPGYWTSDTPVLMVRPLGEDAV
jgi:hypothetical protein